MTAVWAWARVDVRRRWRSLVVLAVLVALSAATVMTAVAGARRAESALDRLLQATDAATVQIPVFEPGFDWAPVERLPEVEASARFISGGVGTLGDDDGLASEALVDTPTDPRMLVDLERPVVLEGRMYDVRAADEAVVTPAFAAQQHVEVGDTVPLRFPAPEQIGMGGDSEYSDTLQGPVVDLWVVGVVRSPLYADWPGGPGAFIPSPGLALARPELYYGDGGRADPATPDQLLVRLAGGEADVDRFRADVAEVTGRNDLDVRSLVEGYQVHQGSIRFEAAALLALGGAAAIAALFLVGQAIWRHVAAGAEHLVTLQALGMSRGQRLAGAVVPPFAAGGVGAVLGATASVVASRWFPLGTAAVVEPEPGMRADPLVLVVGVAGCILVVATIAFLGAVAALGGVRRRGPAPRPSKVVAAVGHLGFPLPVHLGSRFALEPGRGRVRIPVASTLLVAVLGVGGLLGALVVADGVQQSLDHPDRFGRTYDTGTFTGFSGNDFVPTQQVRRAVLADPAVAGAGALRVATATAHDARSSVVLYGVDDGANPLETVVLDGRMPESQDEVALAPRSLDGLGVAIGDTVRLTGSRDTRTLTVVGTVLMPEGPDNRYDEGGWLSRHGFDRLFDGFDLRLLLLAGADGRSADEVSAAANAAVAREVPDAVRWLLPFEPPSDNGLGEQLREVRLLPYVLGGFLALLAAGVVGHALVTAVRRRSAELATLRAVGTTPAQAAGIVYAQSGVAAVVGLGFGVPLGVALGRTVWRLVAESTPLLYVPPTAWWAVLSVVPAAALSAAVFAVLPAARAARGRVADVLRTE